MFPTAAILALLAAPMPAPAADSPPPRPRVRNVLAWPIYVRWESDGGNSLRMYGPMTASWRSPDQRAFHAIFPTTGFRRFATGRRELDVVWPLTSLVRDRARGYTSLSLATPLVGYERRAGDGVRSLKLRPLFASVHEPDGKRRFELAPFVYRADEPAHLRRVREYGYVPMLGGLDASLVRTSSDANGRSWNALVVFGGGERADTRWLSILPYGSYERLTGPGSPSKFRALLPLFASYRSPESRWWDVAVIYGGGRAGNRSVLSLPPWFATSKLDSAGHPTRFQALVPLYAHWQWERSGLAIAAPSYWRYRSERMTSSGLWPLYAKFARTHADGKGHSGGSIAWPLVTWGSGDAYSSFGLLPLYYRVVDGTTRVTFSPFYGSFQRPGFDRRVAPPFYLRWWGRSDSLEAITLYYRRRSPGRLDSGVFPLYGRAQAADLRLTWLAPFWYHRRDAKGEQRLGFPGWGEWRSLEDERRTRFAGPVVLTRGRESRGFGIVPIYYTGSGPAGRSTLLGPAYWSRGTNGSRSVVVFPLAWYSRTQRTTQLHLLPLTGFRSHADGRRMSYVLWPLYTHRSTRQDFSRTSYLLWLGRNERRGERRRSWAQPLFYYDSPNAQSSWLAILGGLLASYERDGESRRVKVLMIPVRTWKS